MQTFQILHAEATERLRLSCSYSEPEAAVLWARSYRVWPQKAAGGTTEIGG